MKPDFNYGGMAVIEGVAMIGPEYTSIAVRKANGEVELGTEPVTKWVSRYPFLKWPFIRGTYVLINSLVVGMRMLNKSANWAMEGEEEELSTMEIFLSGLFAIVLAVLLFIILPTAIVHFTSQYWGGNFVQNIVEGIIRITFFLLYVYAISRLEDIKRVFMYHGAEHKVILAYEAGQELTVDNARNFSTLHPRCGTSFLLIVMIISILVFAMLGEGSLFYRIWSRLAMLPIVAGLGYEFIKFSGKYYNNKITRVLIMPGLWLQKLTTREPDDGQLEVAIIALKAVLTNNRNITVPAN